MPTEKIAKQVFKDARTYYEAGLKSANKSYDEADASWWKLLSGKARQRNIAQPKASFLVSQVRATPTAGGTIARGQFLYQSAGAGNCGELAMVSCYLANQQGVPANQLALAGVHTPNRGAGQKGADHAFCLYGENALLVFLSTMRVDPTMKDIDRSAAFRNKVFAIDPWANTCCSLEQYPSKIAAKMASWGAYGKRVLWVYAPGQGAWADPAGEYATVFAAASFSVAICT